MQDPVIRERDGRRVAEWRRFFTITREAQGTTVPHVQSIEMYCSCGNPHAESAADAFRMLVD